MANDPDTAETPPDGRLERCPQCRAKLPEVPVSLCPYCASPLQTGGRDRSTESRNAARIARVREHEAFEDAMAHVPPETLEWQVGARRLWWCRAWLGVGAALLVVAFATHLEDGLAALWSGAGVLGLLAVVAGLALGSSGRSLQAHATSKPLLKRPALVLDRRSETTTGAFSGRTTYFFELEFEGGVVGEFAFPGRGAQDEPYATNLPGVAYTRGERLLEFKHVRV